MSGSDAAVATPAPHPTLPPLPTSGRLAFAVTAVAMIATPLARPRSRARAALADVVIVGLAGTTLAATGRRWGAARTARAAAVVFAGTAAIEKIGTRTGLPFGRYRYTGALRPQIAGLPIVVPAAWVAMALPAREVGGGSLAAGALALTAWDVFLDPQMTAEGYWTWDRAGRYRGIPATNFAGWFLTGLAVMAALRVLLPEDRTAGRSSDPAPASDPAHASDAAVVADGPIPSDPVLGGVYAWMAVMSTVGFAVFFRDRRVALAGAAAMGPFVARWMGRWQRSSS